MECEYSIFLLLLCLGCLTWSSSALPRNAVCSDTQALLRDIHANQGRVPNAGKEVSVAFEVRRVESVEKSNLVHIDGYLILRWQADDYLTVHYPCTPSISITDYANGLWKPSVSFSNGEHIIYHKHSKEVIFTSEQEIIWRQRVEQRVPCTVDPLDFPFGILACPIKLRAADPAANFRWADQMTNSSIGTGGKLESLNELRVHALAPVQTDPSEREMVLALEARREASKPLLIFFLPSIIFMAMSWLSLALGPMAITRSIIIVGSFVLLLMHFNANQLAVPETEGMTGVDIWRLFSLFFVLATLVELVLVTCMASAGRSRRFSRCCTKKGKGKGKDLEPEYEELNDLRMRKTRRTCGCCRYSALFFDFLAMLVLLAVFIIFAVFFFTRGRKIVECVNRFRIHDLLVF